MHKNGALIGTEQTITDNGIAGNTRHRIMSVDSANTLDNFTVHLRTSPSYDNNLDRYSGIK